MGDLWGRSICFPQLYFIFCYISRLRSEVVCTVPPLHRWKSEVQRHDLVHGTEVWTKTRVTAGIALHSVIHEEVSRQGPCLLLQRAKGHIFPFMSFHSPFFHSGFRLPVWLESSVIGQQFPGSCSVLQYGGNCFEPWSFREKSWKTNSTLVRKWVLGKGNDWLLWASHQLSTFNS